MASNPRFRPLLALPAVALPVLLVLVSSGHGRAAQTPVFPTGTELVLVDVVVTDAEGRPLAGLTRADFTVEDEGERQEIVEFEAVDVTGGTPTAPETATWARVATNRESSASSRAFLIVFDDLHLS